MISTGNYPECLVLILLILFNVNISSNNIQEFRNLKPTLIRIVILLIQKSEHVFRENNIGSRPSNLLLETDS
jgi:hypothetical protein